MPKVSVPTKNTVLVSLESLLRLLKSLLAERSWRCYQYFLTIQRQTCVSLIQYGFECHLHLRGQWKSRTNKVYTSRCTHPFWMVKYMTTSSLNIFLFWHSSKLMLKPFLALDGRNQSAENRYAIRCRRANTTHVPIVVCSTVLHCTSSSPGHALFSSSFQR